MAKEGKGRSGVGRMHYIPRRQRAATVDARVARAGANGFGSSATAASGEKISTRLSYAWTAVSRVSATHSCPHAEIAKVDLLSFLLRFFRSYKGDLLGRAHAHKHRPSCRSLPPTLPCNSRTSCGEHRRTLKGLQNDDY
jgi:hypothetical protein